MVKARPLADRFWEKVDKSGECWLWLGAVKRASGYGSFGARKGDIQPAHRVSYRLAFGEIPEGLFVCHRCDNRRCVRPDHLFVGTQKDNIRDMWTKGRWRYQSRDQSGERNPNSIISDVQVRAMLTELAAGSRPVATATKYGISYKTLWAIRHRKP